jgi:hypothetical protein
MRTSLYAINLVAPESRKPTETKIRPRVTEERRRTDVERGRERNCATISEKVLASKNVFVERVRTFGARHEPPTVLGRFTAYCLPCIRIAMYYYARRDRTAIRNSFENVIYYVVFTISEFHSVGEMMMVVALERGWGGGRCCLLVIIRAVTTDIVFVRDLQLDCAYAPTCFR